MDPETIEQEFGVKVKRQLNVVDGAVSGSTGGGGGSIGYSKNATRHLTDEEYFRRYGRAVKLKISSGEGAVGPTLLSNIVALKQPDDSKEPAMKRK